MRGVTSATGRRRRDVGRVTAADLRGRGPRADRTPHGRSG